MFFNQSKVTKTQIPKKVLQRRTHQFARTFLWGGLFIWLLYLTFVHGGGGYQDGKQPDFAGKNSIGPNGLLSEIEPEASMSPVMSQLQELLVYVAETGATQERQDERNKIIQTILKQIVPPAGTISGSSILLEDTKVLTVTLDETAEIFTVTTLLETKSFANTQDFTQYLRTFTESDFTELVTLQERQNSLQDDLQKMLVDSEVAALLDSKNLSFKTINDGRTAVIITNQKGSELAVFSINAAKPAYVVSGQIDQEITPNQLRLELGKLLGSLDERSELEKIMAQQISEFSEILAGNELTIELEAAGLQFSEPQEKVDGLYVDLVDQNKQTIFTLLLEKGTGLVYVLTDETSIPLREYLDQQKKKPESITTDDSGLTALASADTKKEQTVYLLAGKHGTMTDTMILAFVDDSKRRVSLLSVPRDLFWQGRKINSYFAYWKMESLVEQLEQIFKIDIANYMLVDMYAFIDVVNILGGVQITLEQPVVDPTYKTFDNGEWGTLNYPAGTYHLNGVQALRLARTRHTSSDFARAERQQMILSALKDKAEALSFWDVSTLSALAGAILEQVETDISLPQAVALYNDHKDYEIVNLGVLSSGNVLYSTYSNQDGYTACIARGEAECSKGAYILLPRNDNWSRLPNYVRSLLSQG